MKKNQVNYGFIVQGCEEDVIMVNNYLQDLKDRYGLDKIVFYEETEDIWDVEKALLDDVADLVLHALMVEKKNVSLVNFSAKPQYQFLVQNTGYSIFDYVSSLMIKLMRIISTKLGPEPVEISAYETTNNAEICDLLSKTPLTLTESMDDTSFTLTPALTTASFTTPETLMAPMATILSNMSRLTLLPHVFINLKFKNLTKLSLVVANPYPILIRPTRIEKDDGNLFGLEDSDHDDDDDNFGFNDDDDDDDDDNDNNNNDDDDDDDDDPGINGFFSTKLSKLHEPCIEDMNVLKSLIKREAEEKGCNWNERLFTKLLKPHIVNVAVDTVCIGHIFDDEMTALSQWTLSLLKSIKELTTEPKAKKPGDASSDSENSPKEKVPQVKVLIHDTAPKTIFFSSEHKKSSSSSSSSSSSGSGSDSAEVKAEKKQDLPGPIEEKKKIVNTSTSSTSPTTIPLDNPPKPLPKVQHVQPKKDAKHQVKKDDKPQVKKDDKPQIKKDDKPQIKKDVKTQVKKDDKPQVKKDDKPQVKKTTKMSLSMRPSLTTKQSTRTTTVEATPMKSSKKSQGSGATTAEAKPAPKSRLAASTALTTVSSSSKRIPPVQEKLQPKPEAKATKASPSQKVVGTQSLRSKPAAVSKPRTLLSQSQSQMLASKIVASQPSQAEKRQQKPASPSIDERSSWEEREKYLLKRLHEAEGLYAAQRNENIRLKMAFEDLKSVTEKRLGDIKDRMVAQNERYKQELLKYDSIISNQASTIAELQRQFLKLYQTKLSSVVIRKETLGESGGGLGEGDGIVDDDDDDDEYYREDIDRSTGYAGGAKSFNNFCPCHTDMITLEKLISQQRVDIKNLEKRLEASERNHVQQKVRYEEEIERLKKGRGLSYGKPDTNIMKRLDAYKLPELEEVCGKVMDALDRCLEGLPHHESMDALSSVDRDFSGRSPDDVVASLKRVRDILQIIITHIQIF